MRNSKGTHFILKAGIVKGSIGVVKSWIPGPARIVTIIQPGRFESLLQTTVVPGMSDSIESLAWRSSEERGKWTGMRKRFFAAT
jgi:hypothetical protein